MQEILILELCLVRVLEVSAHPLLRVADGRAELARERVLALLANLVLLAPVRVQAGREVERSEEEKMQRLNVFKILLLHCVAHVLFADFAGKWLVLLLLRALVTLSHVRREGHGRGQHDQADLALQEHGQLANGTCIRKTYIIINKKITKKPLYYTQLLYNRYGYTFNN